MNRTIFIDTGALVGLFFKRDSRHRPAVETWQKIRKDCKQFVTTNHVLVELATLLGRKTDFAYSARKMNRVYHSDIEP